MRDKYWALYTYLVDCKFYYWHYREHSTFWDTAINLFLCITSVGGIATWAVWKQLPWLWAIIVAASQLINSFRKYLPFSKRITSVTMLLPELDGLINEIDHVWDKVDTGMEDEEISDAVYQFNCRYTELEYKYAKDSYFPRKKRCEKESLVDRENYFFQKYGIKKSEKFKEGIV